MLTLREIVGSVYGAWRLAHLDRRGMAYFDATESGFWRSFRVAFLLLPVELVSLALQLHIQPSEAGLARIVAVDLIGYAIGWMAFPLAAHYLVMALDKEREYVGYIVAYNWANVILAPIQPVLFAMIASGLVPDMALLLLINLVRVAVLIYAWFIARAALGIGGWPAAGLVSVDFMISLLLYVVIESMMY